MDSEKATAVSPSSPLRARGPSVLDLLRGAATPTNSGQARRTDREQKTTKSRRKGINRIKPPELPAVAGDAWVAPHVRVAPMLPALAIIALIGDSSAFRCS